MTVQNRLHETITQLHLPEFLHGVASHAVSPDAQLTLSTHDVNFTPHPLSTLHTLVAGAVRGLKNPNDVTGLAAVFQNAPTVLRQAVYYEVWRQGTDAEKQEENFGERNALTSLPRLFNAVFAVTTATYKTLPEELLNSLHYQIWELGTEAQKKEENFGEKNALTDMPRLLEAIDRVARQKLESLPGQKKMEVYQTIHRMAQLPAVENLPQWAETQARENTGMLIRSLHRNGSLSMPGTPVRFFAEFEREAQLHSVPFHLGRPELRRGEICFTNGMTCSRDTTRENATRLSDSVARGHNIHCVYSATSTIEARDIASGILGCSGIATPVVPLLLEQWQDFFETTNDRLLQICTSRGAIEVSNALTLLPEELRQRIIVIAIAPASLIPAERAFQVVNLVIPSDPVIQGAHNRHLMNAPHTVTLPEHTDGSSAHDMNGSSYREWLAPRIAAYLETNTLG